MAEERTLKEYATLSTEEPYAIIVYPTVEGNNFEIKPALIYLVQQNQFFGSPTKDPIESSCFKFFKTQWNREGKPRGRKAAPLSFFLRG